MVTWLGVRQSRSARSRRLGLEAAKLRLAEARRHQVATRVTARVKRAEVTRLQAEQAAARATAADVAAARRALASAQREVKAASANVRAQRAQVSAARAMLPLAAQQPPLERLVAEHDALTARWLEYETDPARLIAFPALSDMRVPETAAFVAAQQRALGLRPAGGARTTPAEFAAYRDAVEQAARAFEVAEATAWRQADRPVPSAGAPQAWTTVAESVIRRSAEALGRAADSAFATMREATETRDAAATHSDPGARHGGPAEDATAARGGGRTRSEARGDAEERSAGVPRDDAARAARTTPTARGTEPDAHRPDRGLSAPAAPPACDPAPQPVWPVPSRGSRRP